MDEIYDARDHGCEQKRVDPPIFRRPWIFGDAVEQRAERQNWGAAAMRHQFAEGLDRDHHRKREQRDDGGCKNRVHDT